VHVRPDLLDDAEAFVSDHQEIVAARGGTYFAFCPWLAPGGMRSGSSRVGFASPRKILPALPVSHK
jgi:hypothetical protein